MSPSEDRVADDEHDGGAAASPVFGLPSSFGVSCQRHFRDWMCMCLDVCLCGKGCPWPAAAVEGCHAQLPVLKQQPFIIYHYSHVL